jgi:hypothetical protein
MTPAQDAVVIEDMWSELVALEEENGNEPDIKEFARQISRSVDVVKDSIAYVQKIDKTVQKLVEAKIISYTMALLLSGISKEEKGFGVSDQLRYAQTFVTRKFTVKQAREYLNNRKGEEGQFALEENEVEAILRDHILSLRQASGMRVRESALWFTQIIRMVKLLDNREVEAKFSAGIQKVLANLDFTISDFQKDLKPLISEKDLVFLFGDRKGDDSNWNLQ